MAAVWVYNNGSEFPAYLYSDGYRIRLDETTRIVMAKDWRVVHSRMYDAAQYREYEAQWYEEEEEYLRSQDATDHFTRRSPWDSNLPPRAFEVLSW